MRYFYLLLFFVFLIFSCKTMNTGWDGNIQEKRKSDLLIRYLNEEYKDALSKNDLQKLTKILKELDWIDTLDKTKLGAKLTLYENINYSIGQIKKKKINRASILFQKKDVYGAILEYLEVLNIEPSNEDAKLFFEKNEESVNKTIASILPSIKKIITNGNYSSAETVLLRLQLVSKNPEISTLLKEINKLRIEKNNKMLIEAKKSFNEKDYNKSLSLAKQVLDFDNKNNKAIKIYENAFFEIQNLTKQEKGKLVTTKTTKKTNTDKSTKVEDISKTTEPIYNRALTFFNEKRFKDAKDEISKYFDLTDDKKGRELESKILSALKEQKSKIDTIIGDAILNYNSEKYEVALKQFNQVLSLDPDNEEALEYSSRIQMRMKAFE
ncbi:MAG TPA: hypothetical protein PK771_08300 [Spirochaetota bacterium]|mgnify:CR=1 FL=1|nr:hypothetical protein [Spirochaetota bacterium]